eukprot:TRINITY_DN1232_c0_g1_i2.p1 TRINITY_DN1232_c0_g1~~TRINITY_DN1232_c0_g1_i2.p1  ORF type:complete len:611 (+),score=176.75 TRINITY_DN1232_c0_g1_i2:55-1833(+)
MAWGMSCHSCILKHSLSYLQSPRGCGPKFSFSTTWKPVQGPKDITISFQKMKARGISQIRMILKLENAPSANQSAASQRTVRSCPRWKEDAATEARAKNVPSYDAKALSELYSRQPFNVLTRALRIIVALGAVALAILWDKQQVQIEEDMATRARQLRLALIDLGPTFVKLGQALSTRPDLCPPAYLDGLALLQDALPIFPNAVAFTRIEDDLCRPLEQIFSSITSEPVAAASLGQDEKTKQKGKGKGKSSKEKEFGGSDSESDDDEKVVKAIKEKTSKKDDKKYEEKKMKKMEVETLKFVKYQGLGNDFILVDNRGCEQPLLSPEQSAALCNRNFGIGADGVIFVLPGGKGTDYSMRIYNSDGSEPEMCGNGIRCFARFVADLEERNLPHTYNVMTLAGVMHVLLREDGQVEVDMGCPTLKAAEVPTTILATTAEGAVVAALLEVEGQPWRVTCVSMGNPHCVTFGDFNGHDVEVEKVELATIGPKFEHHPAFPARTNTEFVEVLSRSELRMKVWERGAGATLACGTGACAVVVAAVLEGRADRKCVVHLPGGPLEIEWREEDGHVVMTGPAQRVFAGKVSVKDLLLPAPT